MFSQRNSPYCDLLQIIAANIRKKVEMTIFYRKIYIFEKKAYKYGTKAYFRIRFRHQQYWMGGNKGFS